ncbi:TPA: TIGR02646 family protein [Proteus mirabilis]|uniref:TIGR02646 family protein n=1 Tax=Proteus mirabilis TaxID=584 RepID=UPI001BB0CB7B|nr:TIGR02646 family protein [Proteus mirabilis]MBS3855299.1 TIGR02646 family protein [Proteus mirabilis]HEK2942155.1 TIGR02646 family protein [Proteus mirabilis]
MRKISKKKGYEPPSLTQWKKQNKNKKYIDLTPNLRAEIRAELLKEQFYLCGHCCQQIPNIQDCHNEHIEPQQIAHQRTLDYSNIIVSCNSKKQCGDSHKHFLLPITPFDDRCETELQFSISGRVKGLTQQAQDTIRILNLGDNERTNKVLIEKRKIAISTILFSNGINSNIGLEDDDLLNDLIIELSKPNDVGKLESFSPIVINVLKQWLSDQ